MKTPEDIIYDVLAELDAAKVKHPDYPCHSLAQCAIMIEEAGEVQQAVNDYAWHNGSIENVKTELRQAAAMCIRMLEKIEAQQ